MAIARLPTQDIARALSEGLTEVSIAFSQAARALRHAFNITVDTTNELWRSYYLAVGQYTFPIEGEVIATPINPPRPLANFHPAAHVGFFPFALIAFVSSITIVPLVGNSITSFVELFVWTANIPLLDLADAQKIPYPTFWEVKTGDDQRGIVRNIYGVPGLLLGAIGGAITAIAITMGRVIKHSSISFAVSFTMILDFSLVTKINFHDERSNLEKYGFGLVGQILGAAFGSIASLIVANASSFSNMAKTVMSAAWNVGSNDTITNYIGNDQRHPANKYFFGGIGVILGAVAGGISSIIIASAVSFFNMTSTVMSTAWNVGSNNAITNYIGNDQRHPVNKYLFGGIGIILGAVAGGVLGLGILAGRVFRQSISSFNTFFITMLNFSLATKIQRQDERTAKDKYGFGLVGCALGVVFGSITSFIVANALSFFNMMKTVMSVAWNVGSDSAITNHIKNDKRHDVNKYGVGLINIILGTVAGSVLGLGILTGRCIKQSVHSFLALSGSFFNIGLRLYHHKFSTPPFEGIGGDDRLSAEKGMGALGYVAACFTTGPIALVMLSVASAATLSIMFLSLITIGTGKLIRKLVGPSAFADKDGDDKQLMDKFRNLRSSLNESGLFAGDDIVQNGDGKEKSWRAFVRSASLNSPTLTEKLLYSLLKAYRANNHSLSDAIFKKVMDEVKDYCEKDPRATPESIVQDKEEVQRVGDFIKDYLTNNDAPAREASAKAALPNLYHNAHVPFLTAVACTFWGGKKNAALPPASDADLTLDERQLSPASI